jgi:type III restriction enzyme
MTHIFLQNMLENLPKGILPSNWADFDLAGFSRRIHLWEYQQTALRNALLALWKYYSLPGQTKPERKQSYLH